VKEREPGIWFKKDVNLVWAGTTRRVDCRVKDDVTGLGTGTYLLSVCSKKAVTDQSEILFSVGEHKQRTCSVLYASTPSDLLVIVV
jgi:hypothetical protein